MNRNAPHMDKDFGNAAPQRPAKEELVKAAEKKDFAAVQDLLARNAEVDEADDDGYTALMYAAENSDIAMMQMLIESGAGVNIENDNQSTALMIAMFSYDPAAVRLLIESGAAVSERDLVTAMAFVQDAQIMELMENAPQIRQQALEEKARAKAEAEAARLNAQHTAAAAKQKAMRARAVKITVEP